MKKLKKAKFILLILIIFITSFALDVIFGIITFILFKSILCKFLCH
jgi:hypothetical protein